MSVCEQLPAGWQSIAHKLTADVLEILFIKYDAPFFSFEAAETCTRYVLFVSTGEHLFLAESLDFVY